MADKAIEKEPLTRRGLLKASALSSVAAFAAGCGAGASGPAAGDPAPSGVDDGADLVVVNGVIHTMNATNQLVASVAIKNGRFTSVGDDERSRNPRAKVINAGGRTVIPGIIDAHNHIVLVGNRPGWHTPMEHVFTTAEAVAAYKVRAAGVPAGEFITTIGPISAMQFAEQRLPNLAELDGVDKPVYIQAAQGGASTNTAGKTWLQARGVTVSDTGVVAGGNAGTTLALRLLREQLLTPATRKRSAADALKYYATLGIVMHRDAGAFQSDVASGGIANENTYTMHRPFLAHDREKTLPARLRVDFLHQDAANDAALPTLSDRLRNSFPFFGNDWMKTGGVGEFTGGGVPGLRAIAAEGWRAEDHTLNLATFSQLVTDREIVNAEIPLKGLRWIISHVPQVTVDLVNRFKAMGGGVLVGWGPTRTRAVGTPAVGPIYRTLYDNGIPLGYHSDGGDVTVINPWLNFYTMITGKNLRGDVINDDQVLTRQEVMRLATTANKWFIWEDDIGSIEPGNHADLVILDRDYFSVPDAELPRIHSELTVIGGKVMHSSGAVVVPA
jgi:predicted amidohydrolase YtcJ